MVQLLHGEWRLAVLTRILARAVTRARAVCHTSQGASRDRVQGPYRFRVWSEKLTLLNPMLILSAVMQRCPVGSGGDGGERA
jgi:hypothetical protein